MDRAQTEHKEREHFFGAAKVVAGLTVLSRIAGMVRDMAITSLGANRATGAFILAFQIPNLFRRLFGEGALSGAFVPVFTETNEKEGPEKAGRLFANAMGLLAVFLLGLMVLMQLGLLAWSTLCPGLWDRQLLLALVGIMLPFMVTICLLALGSAVMNCRGHFAYPAAAPIILNLFIIAAAWGARRWLGEDLHQHLYLIAASVVVAGVVQLAGVLWLLRRSGTPIRPRVTPIEKGIRPMIALMAPMLLGLGFLQISPFFDSIIIWILTATREQPILHLMGWEIARPLTEAAQTQVYAAQRLYQFPMGVLAISLSVAVFPLFSRYAARQETQNLRDALNRALRLAMMEGLATGAGLLMLADPVTQLIYQRGDFTQADAAGSAFVLQMYVLGMWAYCTYQIFSRAFFALKDTRTPLKVSCGLVILNIVLVSALVWVPSLRAGAFGLATAFTASVSSAILAIVLRRRLGRFGGRKLAFSVGRSLAACAAMAAVLWAMQQWALPGARPWVVVSLCVPAGAAVFLAVAFLLRAPELGELFAPLAARFRKKPA